MQIYGLKNCDTCRKALKALPDAELVDVRADGVPDALLAKAYARFGDALVNTRSTTWRGLSGDERALPPLEVLKRYPSLMKRPLIVDGDALHLGWTKDVQTALGAA
jgi:arsenate reductase